MRGFHLAVKHMFSSKHFEPFPLENKCFEFRIFEISFFINFLNCSFFVLFVVIFCIIIFFSLNIIKIFSICCKLLWCYEEMPFSNFYGILHTLIPQYNSVLPDSFWHVLRNVLKQNISSEMFWRCFASSKMYGKTRSKTCVLSKTWAKHENT